MSCNPLFVKHVVINLCQSHFKYSHSNSMFVSQLASLTTRRDSQRPPKFTSSFLLFIWFSLQYFSSKDKWARMEIPSRTVFPSLCGRWAFIRNFLVTYFSSFTLCVWCELNKIFDWIKLFLSPKKDWITQKCCLKGIRKFLAHSPWIIFEFFSSCERRRR